MTYEESLREEAEREAERLVGRPFIRPYNAAFFAFSIAILVCEGYLNVSRGWSLIAASVVCTPLVLVLKNWEARFQRVSSNEYFRIERENGLRAKARIHAQ